MLPAQIFEALMLVSFGVSWPVAIAKTLRAQKVHGKSLGFLYLVLVGYICGIIAKLIAAKGGWPNWVTPFYALNGLFVVTEIVLYYRYRGPADEPALDIQPRSPAVQVSRRRD